MGGMTLPIPGATGFVALAQCAVITSMSGDCLSPPAVSIAERRATTAQTAAVSLHERPHDPAVADSRSGTSYGEPQASVEDRKDPLVSVGPNRLVTSLCQARWCWRPPRLHTPTPAIPTRQRSDQSGQHGRGNPNFRAHYVRTPTPPIRSSRLCRSQAWTPEPDDRQNGAAFDTPTRYKKEGLRPRLRRSEALSCTRWQVKDSNLRSFRDGFTVLGRQACDQQKCLSTRQLPCVFGADS
jgi:hypothetical protein